MARMAAEGHRVVLVTATNGELGEVPDGLLSPGEDLAARRDDELAEACRVLGVSRRVSLGYRDSGMAGTPTTSDPACFARANVEVAARRVATILAEEDASVVTAYDENGGYGHPDHVQVHRVGLRAAVLAGTPRVFMATQNRDHLLGLLASEMADGVELPGDRRAQIAQLGVDEARVTAAVDVTAWLDAKRAAMRAHASQIGETSFFLSLPDEAFRAVWGTEWYVRVGGGPGSAGPIRWAATLLE